MLPGWGNATDLWCFSLRPGEMIWSKLQSSLAHGFCWYWSYIQACYCWLTPNIKFCVCTHLLWLQKCHCIFQHRHLFHGVPKTLWFFSINEDACKARSSPFALHTVCYMHRCAILMTSLSVFTQEINFVFTFIKEGIFFFLTRMVWKKLSLNQVGCMSVCVLGAVKQQIRGMEKAEKSSWVVLSNKWHKKTHEALQSRFVRIWGENPCWLLRLSPSIWQGMSQRHRTSC